MYKSNKVKVGVVGVGALGRHHARLYRSNDQAEVIGVYDANPETAQAVANEFGLTAYNDINELADKCDALSVAVPADLHGEITVPLLQKGKHVLVEKPLASSYKDGKAMVEAAQANNVVLAVGHVERFNPAMDFLQRHAAETRFIEAHRLAKYPPPRQGQHRRGTEVSVILDLMIHDIDLVLTMVDSEVERFDAVGIPVLSSSEDIVSVRIKFKNGSCANMTASRVSEEPQRRFRVFMEDTYISMDYGSHSGMVLKKNKIGLARKDVSLDEKNALAEELADFLKAVQSSQELGKIVPAKVSGEAGLKALKLAEDIVNEITRYNKEYGFHFSQIGS